MEPHIQHPDPDNSISVDVLPLNPRPGTLQNEDPVEVNLDFPSPPVDWKFNIFLDRIADDVSTEEFKKMKYFFSGIIGKGVLERLESTEDLFQAMRQRCFLNKDNLLYLQGLLFHLKRQDLVKKCVEYARTIKNVTHFTSPQENPADGFKFIRIHVEGRDFSNFNRRYIETLRQRVADILFIPRENVFVAGIEPSSSMLVVVIIPDLYVKVLVELLEDNRNLEELAEIGVDIIGINDKQYNIRGIEEAEIVLSDQQEKLVNVYRQLETKTKQLEEREIECLSLHKRLKIVDKDRLTSEAHLAVFKKMFHNVVPEAMPNTDFQPAALECVSALEEFKSILKFAESTCYDKDFILALLNANTTVVVNRLKQSYKLQFNRLRIELADLRSSVIPLHLELQKYQFITQVNSEQLDEIIFESLANAIERKLKAEVTISLSVHYLQATTISRKLRFKEKIKLKDQYEWPKDDPLTSTIEKEPNLFLCCIYLKEVEKQAIVVEPVSFLLDQLQKIGRKDLVAKLQTLITSQPLSASKKKPKTPSIKRGQSPHVHSEKSPHDKQTDKSPQVELESISHKVDSIQKKVESIFEVLNEFPGKPPSYSSIFPDTGMYPSFSCNRYPYGKPIFRTERETEQ